MRFALKVLCRNSPQEGLALTDSSLLPLGPPQMVDQMALSHLLLEEARCSREGLRLAPDKAHVLSASPSTPSQLGLLGCRRVQRHGFPWTHIKDWNEKRVL